MQALFVHGMGRSPLSGWPLLWQLKRAGLKTSTYGYSVSLEDFAGIKARLVSTISALAELGDYVLIGHSLGGVLLRAAVNGLPPGVRSPHHVFLLGSPLQPTLLAQRLGTNPIYRTLTRDCGQLLGSVTRMAEIGPVSAPTTGIAGVRGLSGKRSPFSGELNDGVVSISEVSAEWLTDQVRVPSVHTLLPSSKRVGDIILERVARHDEKGGRFIS
ncbi:hypothetical protein NVV93_03450 [Pseudomonas sp. LS44]|uniref:esterase/lipase family protein n=1 Tax=Pseudomonas sp. LS44 TaxID=1357074 RepID=UPI00215B6E3D|nr:alpha/beta fold hydrolase [Pseudomonas sp. LS44]UVE18470.1 hypothetical protein NVV93_03450 [Pseudomonas sp. LS44]